MIVRNVDGSLADGDVSATVPVLLVCVLIAVGAKPAGVAPLVHWPEMGAIAFTVAPAASRSTSVALAVAAPPLTVTEEVDAAR